MHEVTDYSGRMEYTVDPQSPPAGDWVTPLAGLLLAIAERRLSERRNKNAPRRCADTATGQKDTSPQV